MEGKRSAGPGRTPAAKQAERTTGSRGAAPARPVAHEMPAWAQVVSQPAEVEERRADARAAEALRCPVGRPTPPTPPTPPGSPDSPGGPGGANGRSPGLGNPFMPAGAPAPVRAQAGRGAPLTVGDRARFGASFGSELAGVRVHTDHGAASLAEAVAARAFTVGSHVFFDRRAGDFLRTLVEANQELYNPAE